MLLFSIDFAKIAKYRILQYICGIRRFQQYKFQAMKYFIRSVKYFFYFAILTTLIIIALVMIGAVEGNIDSIFRGGKDSIWQILAFFAIVAAVYPKIGFINRKLYITGEWEEICNTAKEYMEGHRYVLESESDDSLTFRCRNIGNRISKMYEDRIILRKTSYGYALEGLRKDVIRLAAGLEHRLGPQS